MALYTCRSGPRQPRRKNIASAAATGLKRTLGQIVADAVAAAPRRK